MIVKKIFLKHIASLLIFILPFFLLSCAFTSAIDTETENLETNDNAKIEESEYTEQTVEEIAVEEVAETDVEETDKTAEIDIETQREYFLNGIDHFNEGDYLLAEYYLYKIVDKYKILQDHVYYYLAKSLLVQEKFELSEGYYSSLIETYPDSIWAETANLEYADLFYIQEDYIKAENLYKNFVENFSSSIYIPYCLYQQAICYEKNNKIGQAYNNYKDIWLQYPINEYADIALANIKRLKEEYELEPFMPDPEQIYKRAEIFFKHYHYNSAIGELEPLLLEYDITADLKAKAYFRLGMCYYNLGNYGEAKNYLQECFNVSQNGELADDSLYFLARAETNLDEDSNAISHYEQLISSYPQSNYTDDSLYRLGRIYFFQDNLDKAIEKYSLARDKYPGGDRISEILWELGWIHYTRQDYQAAMDIFSYMAESFKSTRLEEEGLFWKAQCLKNLGRLDEAVEIYKSIVNINSYSYYTFVSKEILETMDIHLYIPPIDKSANPQRPDIEENIPEVYSILNKDINEIEISLHIEKAIELLKLGLYNNASIETEAGKDEFEKDPKHILTLSTLFLESRDYYNSISSVIKNYKILKNNLEGLYNDYFYYLLYPYGYKDLILKYSSQYGIDPLFLLAVMRQESHFKEDAGSHAGARGLMQIMPSTGSSIASRIGISGYDLYDPEISIRMGAYYLREQLNNFNNNKFYALGAYNAGPGAMSNWISRWPEKDIFEFIENVPYDETRNYIKIVMENYYLYRMLYG